ncbi:MAG: hypothetical protein P8J78_03890 [Maricaulis sp.]|jgi:hypothetical protein|nr:hypothetical protein [Maricaulis sp.]MDG2043730.1 hypothetical protein [Maricaulis sp.]
MPEIVQDALEFAREGFAEVNAVQGLVVALVAALMLSQWSRLIVIAAGAVIAHVALDVLSPVFAESGDFRLPPLLESWYLRYLGLLYVGYLAIIGILFMVKRVVVKR